MLLQQHASLYSNTDVISFVIWIIWVMQTVAFGESAQLKTLTVFVLVKIGKLLF